MLKSIYAILQSGFLVILTVILVILTLHLISLNSQLISLTGTLTSESTSTAVLTFVGGDGNQFLSFTNNTFATINDGSAYGGAAYLGLLRNCNYNGEVFNISIPFQFIGNNQTHINVRILPVTYSNLSFLLYGQKESFSAHPVWPPVNASVNGVYLVNYYNSSISLKASNNTKSNYPADAKIAPGQYRLNLEIILSGYLNSSANFSINKTYLLFSVFATFYPSTVSINDYSVYETIGAAINNSNTSKYCIPLAATYT